MDGFSPQPVKREVEEAPSSKDSSENSATGTPAGRSNKAMQELVCFAIDCVEERMRNQKWCKLHKRACAAMAANAKKQGKSKEFSELMANETTAKIAMRDWCADNPPDSKWSRKRLHDFAQYTKSQGSLSYQGDGDWDEPKTEAEFMKWAVEQKCLLQSGAEKWWKELLASPCRKDYFGRRPDGAIGALRIWAPTSEFAERKKGRYEDSKITEGSKQMKKLSSNDMEEMRDFAVSGTADEAFLRGEKRSRDSDGAESSNPNLSVAEAQDDGNDAAPNPSPVKQVDLALQKPKIILKQKNELNALSSSLKEVATKCMEQLTASEAAAEKDSALKALTIHLAFRLRCIAAFNGYSDEVKFLESLFGGQDSLEVLLSKNHDKLPIPEDMLPHLKFSLCALGQSFDDITSVTCVAELEDKKDNWAKQKAALKALEKGASQAMKDVKAYRTQKEKEDARKAKADQKKKEKEELDAHKENSDQRAKALLEETKQSVTKPAYMACQFMLQKLTDKSLPDGFQLKTFEEATAEKLGAREKPFVFSGHIVEKWSVDANLRKTSQSFALKYKSYSEYAAKGRVSAAMEPKHAGFSPTMRFVGLQANGTATLKAGLMGEVLHLSISCVDILKGLESIGKIQKDAKFPSVDAFCHLLEDLDMDAFVKMHKAGVEIYVHKLTGGQILSVPLSWFTFELSVDGAVVVYARRGYFPMSPSESEKANYVAMRNLLERCGKPVDRYDEIYQLMTKPEA